MQFEADPVERVHGAAAGAELDAEIVDGEQRNGVRGPVSCPPLRIDDVAQPVAHQVEAEHRGHQHEAGKSATHHWPEMMKLAPSATMMPHSGVGGRTPSPMNDSPAALRIAQPRLSDTCTIISGMMFGSNCASTMRRLAVAAQPRRLDKAGVAADIRFGAGEAGIERQVDDRGRDDDVGDAVAEGGDDPHRQHEQRKRHDRVDERPTMRSIQPPK